MLIVYIFKERVRINSSLSKKLKKLRIRSGLTQAQLAKRLNVSPSTIGMYEQGRREPKSIVLSQVCRELNSSSDYILDLEEEETAPKFIDLSKVINEFTNFIETEENIMINGVPIDNEEKKRISQALRVATAVALADHEKSKSK